MAKIASIFSYHPHDPAFFYASIEVRTGSKPGASSVQLGEFSYMLRKLVLAGVAVAATGAISGAQAQDGDLIRIATQTIDLANPKVSIDLSKTKAAYHGVRVRAKSGDIDVTCVQVVYSNGSVHNEDRLIHMLQGERSRAIDAGSARHIDLVNVVAKSGKGKATLEVLGYEYLEVGQPRPSAEQAAIRLAGLLRRNPGL